MYKIVYSDFGVSVKVDFPPAKLSRPALFSKSYTLSAASCSSSTSSRMYPNRWKQAIGATFTCTILLFQRKHPTPFGEKLLAPAVAGVLRVSKKLDRFCFYFYLTQYLFGNEVIIPPTLGYSLEISIEDCPFTAIIVYEHIPDIYISAIDSFQWSFHLKKNHL